MHIYEPKFIKICTVVLGKLNICLTKLATLNCNYGSYQPYLNKLEIKSPWNTTIKT